MKVVYILLNFCKQENVDFHDFTHYEFKKNHFKPQKTITDYFKCQAQIILKHDNIYLYNAV
jgi:hypothetical protein